MSRSCLLMLLLLLALAIPARPQDSAALPSQQSVTRSLRDGERHVYTLTAETGQLVHIELAQQGIDVLLTLHDPGGAVVYQADNPNTAQADELLLYVAPQTGRYQLEITPRRKGEAGRYVLTLNELRLASERDRVLAQAEQLYAQGQFVRADGAVQNLRAARAFFVQALALWQSAGDGAGEAQTLHRIAYVERQLGLPEREEHARQALAVAQAAGARLVVSRTLYLYGLMASDKSDFALAASYYAQDIANDDAAGGSQTPYSFVSLAYALQQLGEHQQARENYLCAFAVLQKYPDRYAQAYTHHLYALFLYDVYRDYAGALAEFEKALALRRLTEDLRGQGRTLNFQAQVYRLLNQPAQARATLLQGYEISLQTGDVIAQNDALTELGRLAADTGDDETARDYYLRAILLVDKKNDGSNAPDGHLNLGLLYARTGQETAARAEYEKALRYYQRLQQPSGQAQTLYYLGLLEDQAHRLAAARSYVEQSLALEENAEARHKNERVRTVVAADLRRYYDFYLDVLLRQHAQDPTAGHLAEAWLISERGRARVLLSLLAEARQDIRKGVEATLLQREQSIRQQLSQAASEQTAELRKNAASAQAVALAARIGQLTQDYEEVKASIRANSPQYAALTQPQPLGLAEVQQMLEPGTLLLEYALGPERSYVWAVTRETAQVFPLPAAATINEAVATLRGELGEPDNLKIPRNVQLARFNAAARPLSQMILPAQVAGSGQGPVVSGQQAESRRRTAGSRQQAASARTKGLSLPAACCSPPALPSNGQQVAESKPAFQRLVIVADGSLHYVPFAALPLASGVPLLERYEISYLPSATTLKLLRAEIAHRTPAPRSVAVLANPVFDAADTRVSHAGNKSTTPAPPSRERGIFLQALRETGFASNGVPLPLPLSLAEAQGIIAVAPPATALSVLDFEASRARALSGELSQYRIVHFATHGLLNTEHPELSGLILSLVDPQGRPQNGYLRLHEIYNLNLQADLVVLSACHTGLGREARGEGLIGLTRGFMYAGAPRIVASLWSVDDSAMAAMMPKFYEPMFRQNLRPAAALRTAQLQLRQMSRYRHPFYWAALTLQGEWR